MPKSVSAAGNGAADIMAEHFYSREARIDLLEIWEYIAHDNIDAADRVVGASQLQNQPPSRLHPLHQLDSERAVISDATAASHRWCNRRVFGRR
jgi:hypothetical protein